MFAPPFSLFIYIIYALYLISNGFAKLISNVGDRCNRKNNITPSEKGPKEISKDSLTSFFLFKLIENLTGDNEFYGLILNFRLLSRNLHFYHF